MSTNEYQWLSVESALEQLAKHKANFVRKVSALTTAAQDAGTLVANLRGEIARLEEVITTKDTIIWSQAGKLEQLNADHQELANKFDTRHGASDELLMHKSLLSKKDTEIQLLQTQLNMASRRSCDDQSTLNKYKTQIRKLQTELEGSKVVIETLKKQLQNVEAVRPSQQCDATTLSLERLQKETIANFERAHKETVACFEKTAAELRTVSEAHQQERKKLNDRIKQLEIELAVKNAASNLSTTQRHLLRITLNLSQKAAEIRQTHANFNKLDHSSDEFLRGQRSVEVQLAEIEKKFGELKTDVNRELGNNKKDL